MDFALSFLRMNVGGDQSSDIPVDGVPDKEYRGWPGPSDRPPLRGQHGTGGG
jgi:hypothetical protein